MNNVKCLNPWDPQSKRQYRIDGVYATLNAGQAIGGQAHGVCYAIDQQSNFLNVGCSKDIMHTLCSDHHGTPHAVCYSVGSMNSEGMLSDNPSAGIHETEVARTIDANGSNPACYQGGNLVVIGLSRSALNGGMNAGGMPIGENIQPAITANGCGAICAEMKNESAPNDNRSFAVCYSINGYSNYQECKPTLRASGGDTGGGGEALIVYGKD